MKFSIIIPIYNSHLFLQETISSVLKQSYSKQMIELILINDGSTDNSEEICIFYKMKYPELIKYKKIENSGPSIARNVGLSITSEKTDYVLFLDSDDKISKHYLKNAFVFFKNNPEVKLAVSPIIYMGDSTGEHKLNYRFENEKDIVEITKEYNNPHFFIGGTIFQFKVIKELGLKFRSDLKFFEDAFFVNEALIELKRYGLIKKNAYYYRKRIDRNSLVDISWNNKKRYIDLVKDCYTKLLEKSLISNNKTCNYIGYLIVYHLRLFFIKENYDKMVKILNEEDLNLFRMSLVELLKRIDDNLIFEQRFKDYVKVLFMKIKYGEEYKPTIPRKNNIIIEKVGMRFPFLTICGITNLDNIYVRYNSKMVPCNLKKIQSKYIILDIPITEEKYILYSSIPCYVMKFSICKKELGNVEPIKEVKILKEIIIRLINWKNTFFAG